MLHVTDNLFYVIYAFCSLHVKDYDLFIILLSIVIPWQVEH